MLQRFVAKLVYLLKQATPTWYRQKKHPLLFLCVYAKAKTWLHGTTFREKQHD